jgi:hypothetical protein
MKVFELPKGGYMKRLAAARFLTAYEEFVDYIEGLHESVQGGGDEHSESAGKHPER